MPVGPPTCACTKHQNVKNYKAVLFDLFATVALWRPERMPKFTWEGQSSPSTMGVIRAILAERAATLDFRDFHAAFADANEELAARRAREMKEIPSKERFKLALTKAGLPDNGATDLLAQEISYRHLEQLAGAVEVPTAHTQFLERVYESYAVALVSNFDHGPTARHVLTRDGATPFFHCIVVSDDHGWRKPHAKIFTDTLRALDVAPGDALFVGDSVEDDIVGAKGVGMDIAWINARGQGLPSGIPAPEYAVSAIPELASVLFT
jgi:HAD superfamily hydrolase (TIGR01549 family)